MMMRDLRSFGLRCAIIAATAVATGCGGQPADFGEFDDGESIQQNDAQSNKKSPFGDAPSLKPQSGDGTIADALPQRKLMAPDAQAGDEFGVSVGISGNTLVVGSLYDDDQGYNAGSAYIFTLVNGVWTPYLPKLLQPPKNAKPQDNFGQSVAIFDDRILVGAPGAVTGGKDMGAVYVFKNTNGVWAQTARLVPPPGSAADANLSQFGWAVALEGNIAVIGAPSASTLSTFFSGAAYIYMFDGTTWNFVSELLPGDDGGSTGYFGTSVALWNKTTLIGQLDDGSQEYKGSVFAYRQDANDATQWPLEQVLVASDATKEDLFGFSLSIYNNKAMIGAPYRDGGGCTDAGAVYAFGRYNDIWCEEQIIDPDDKNAGQAFGYSLGMWGETSTISSCYDDDNGDYSGSAYVFRSIDGVWLQQFKYLPIDGSTEQRFGISTSMDGDAVVVGADLDSEKGQYAGAAYQFSVLEDPNAPPPSPLVEEDGQSLIAPDPVNAQCSLNIKSNSRPSPLFLAFGLAALGLRRLSRKTKASA